MEVLTSTVFGAFDPHDPQPNSSLFAQALFADPIEINAPLELVWQIIIDFDSYPEWNPLNRFFRLDGEAAPNHTVTFGPSVGPYPLDSQGPLPKVSMTTRETITVWEPNCCLAYASLRGVMTAERAQFIASLPNGRTRYHTYERVKGLLTPLIRYGFGRFIVAGFVANGLALKQRAEYLASLGAAG